MKVHVGSIAIVALGVADVRRRNTMRQWCNFWNNETLQTLVLCFWRRYAWISTQRDMYDGLLFVTKYVNAEAATLIIIIFPYGQCYFASALTYFCAKTSALYVSRSVDIQAYLVQKQRTSIRKVPLFRKLHHFLIVRTSATPNEGLLRNYSSKT